MGMGVCKGGQSSILFAWARDAPAPSIPEGVGFHVGGDSRINYVTLQIHYGHKDAFADGEDDSSGIKLSMTYQQQPYLAGIYLMVSGEIRVPPHTHSVHTDMACEYNNEVPIYPFAFRTHAHELGKVISGYLIKGDSRGTWFEIAKGDPTWPQAFYPMQPGIEIKRGDWLAARCTYSSERDSLTGVGPTGEDEMCNLYLMYYTDAEFGHSFDMCGQQARGDIESHFPSNSDIPPDEMPAMIEQPPAGQQHGYYGYDDNEYYNPYQLNDYRQRLQDMFGGDRDYPSENFLDLNRNGWIDDDEVLDNKDKAETEKPSKEDDTTPSTSSQKGNKEDEDETTHEEQPKQDTATGKLTLADWHTDDSVTLGQVAGVAVDAKGNVHVFHRAERAWNIESFDANNRYAQADDGPIANNTILAFNKDTGKIEHQWGGKVESVTECATCFNGFYMPHGLSIDHEGNIWLTDVALHQVFKFPPGGAQTPLLTLGEKLTPGPDKDHFCKPADVAVDPTTGNFFVADGYCNSRIMKFSPQGDFLMQWGKVTYKSSGYPSDAFLIPHSLTFLKDKDVLCVADREHGRIQCFNSGDGSYVDSFKQDTFGDRVFAVHYNPWNGGILYAVNGPSGERVPVQGFTLHYGDRQVLQTWKPGNEEFQNPHDVECSADNTAVYVAEIGPNKVWKFDVDIVVSPCAAHPCQNAGHCIHVRRGRGYVCLCPEEYSGFNCETRSKKNHLLTLIDFSN
ncbi:peptidyl-glycine alpha-amidating monooxygenase B-like [Amphiura filiformis]|uniref:peptidyl-glycine alpha-amidating monooxygenase B-like n=1 Tax=Amphiura filiformis TaxID=82378 RepID=UPI003B2191C5